MHLHSRGFTFLELLVTLTIVGVMISLAIPVFSSLHKQQQINLITKSLNQTINFARLQAVFRKENIFIEPKDNDNWQKGWNIKTENKITLRTFSEMPLKIILYNKHKYIKVDINGMTEGFECHFEYSGKKLIINRGGRTRLE
jgi:prepilin-type N-terminal cleavage/methylation domain-containing protein